MAQVNGCDTQHRDQDLIVNVEVTNKGNRTEAFDWDAGGLWAGRVNVAPDGTQMQGPAVPARYVHVGGTPEASTVLPGRTRRFPFLLGPDAAGLYLRQVVVDVSPVELPDAAREQEAVAEGPLIYTWTCVF